MDHHTPIEARTLLVAILRAVVDTHPLQRSPELPWQLSIVTDRYACLWDAREESSQAIAEAISGQFGNSYDCCMFAKMLKFFFTNEKKLYNA